MSQIVNVASVPKRSPFRYPGGKTWLVPEVRQWLRTLPDRPRVLVEPFAGGGIISLTAVFENLVDQAVMVEIDPQMAAAWRTILDDADWLINRILHFDITVESVRQALSQVPGDSREQGFQAILRNRVQRGGILAPGASLMKEGENGRGIASRWYPRTLARRIREIQAVRSRITFVEGDGLQWIEAYRDEPEAAFFIDPPYTAGGKRAGKRLYTYNDVDHERLFALAARVSGEVLMTYDDAPEVVALADRHGFLIRRVPMKNTHHVKLDELLIIRAVDRHDAIFA